MIGTGIIGLFLTIVIVIAVYFLIKLLIDRSPFTDGQIKIWLSYVWLALCVIWLVYVLIGIPHAGLYSIR